ncbi:natural resistance-associated macrophage protein-domain-containing protein [Obelidium mucronatum]|nr:natural resistance-associated macrophage protein-domain-containing protein [Obelidium mucronatum]
MVQTAKRLAAIVLATVGPGSFVAVGYMDPGNWATDLEGGATFNYSLLFVVLLSGLCAIALQSLTIRLGIVTGLDLPQLCRKEFHPIPNFILWILAELAIIATDLAEVIGAAIALKLLFGLPIVYGVLIMGLDVLVVLLAWNQRYLRHFEVFIFLLVLGVGICFMILLPRLNVHWGDAFFGYLPSSILVTDSNALYTCLGILGATVMPHNLYLHSALVHFKSPSYREKIENLKSKTSKSEKSTTRSLPDHQLPLLKKCLHYLNVDSLVSLIYATMVNSFILITAAAAFYDPNAPSKVTGIEDAYHLLWEQLGKGGATVFAVALLFSGQCSTVTGTLAGQVVMEGFLGGCDTLDAFEHGDEARNMWARRLITRGLAIVPALVVTMTQGEGGIDSLLVLSQVVLGVLLPFAVWPLVWFTSSKRIMTVRYVEGDGSRYSVDENTVTDMIEERGNMRVFDIVYANSWPFTILVMLIATGVTFLNLYLLWQTASGK